MQKRTLQWLRRNRFIGTIFDQSRIHFCEERAKKCEICQNFGISILIDDRTDVLYTCRGQVQHLLLFGVTSSQDFVACCDWNIVLKYIESLNI